MKRKLGGTGLKPIFIACAKIYWNLEMAIVDDDAFGRIGVTESKRLHLDGGGGHFGHRLTAGPTVRSQAAFPR